MTSPLLYEVNTRCWLRALSELSSTRITLANVPESEFFRWQQFGFTHIWLMGVWTTGPRARAEALRHPELRKAYDQVLPGWKEADVAGSPYAIGDYEVPEALGGEVGLAAFRRKLGEHGLKLLLDFVPNHLGLDHPWVWERPELFMQSPGQVPGTFLQQTGARPRWLAYGKDPYFAPWTDTVQLDYRLSATRAVMAGLLESMACRCDGVRCDMAMLVLNEVFARTWGHFQAASSGPASEFWAEVIPTIKRAHPGFLLLAEAYWGLERRLQALGFDYTYDKSLYDGLVSRDAIGVQRHLLELPAGVVAASAHFLENHDEPRIASILSPVEHRAAALVMMGLPGMRFLHEGQMDGARIKSPVQLARRPVELAQEAVQKIYRKLSEVLPGTAVGQGRGLLCRPHAAWAGNPTAANFVIVQWQRRAPEFDLVVVNLAPHSSQCYVPLTVEHLTAHNWTMKDLLGTEQYKRSGDDFQSQGLYLDLPAHGAQLFHFAPAS
ncbi:MAG TPA: alpha-amylase family glycosyl hydrolase [Candidatus Paceibacterota bacterium]|nr:alpha-amylase family glycosyl hydrolase [Verrucomicrobiota bacterium]HSA12982.1 alpha-amylase family glycosyl hydrolase [Candidatus Paceibacterota bacterium]